MDDDQTPRLLRSTREQLHADLAQLQALWSRLITTAVVIEQGKRAYTESIELLSGLETVQRRPIWLMPDDEAPG